MANIHPVYLDSNICRNPATVRTYGPYFGLSLDLMLYVAKHSHDPNYRKNLGEFHREKSIDFLASSFYHEFGHSRKHLLGRPTASALKEIFKKYAQEVDEQGRTPVQRYGNTVLEAALFAMATSILLFSGGYEIANKQLGVERTDRFLHIFSGLTVFRKKDSWTHIRFAVSGNWIWNNHMRPQSIDLDAYCRIRTPGTEQQPAGRCWPAGRMLYVRLVYVWGAANAEKHQLPQVSESFSALCVAAGIQNHESHKHMASDLRAWCKRVCELAELPFTVHIEANTRIPLLLGQRKQRESSPYLVTLQRVVQQKLALQA